MGLTQFDIILDNPSSSYFAGQIVSGKVVISLDRPKKIQGVKLKLLGKAQTHWKETSGRTTTTAVEEEDYIDEKVYLFGYESDGSESILPAGEHNYSFYFQLPQKIPSSFESRYGSVKYSLVTVMSRSLKSNFTVKTLFSVNSTFDLNEEWGAKHIGELSKEKQVCCLCCKSGPITFNLRIPRIGFVPGEYVPFQCEMTNHSRRKIYKTTLSLVQNLTFHAGNKTKRKSITIHLIEGPTLQPGNEDIWKSDDPPPPPGDSNETWRLLLTHVIRIPSIPPSRLGGCRIIDAQYSIKMKMEIEDATCLTGHIPIIIGTIPLRTSNISPDTELSPSNQLQLPDSDERRPSLMSSLSLSGYPPPTYEEAVSCLQVTDDEPDSDQDTKPPEYNTVAFNKPERFVPKYATYKMDV